MSIFRDILRVSHEAVSHVHDDTLTLGDDGGTPIKGTLNFAVQLNEEFGFGQDPRELATFDVLEPLPKGTFGGNERSIESNDYLFQGDRRAPNCVKWFVVRRDDNPADITIRFTLRRNVPGKDQ